MAPTKKRNLEKERSICWLPMVMFMHRMKAQTNRNKLAKWWCIRVRSSWWINVNWLISDEGRQWERKKKKELYSFGAFNQIDQNRQTTTAFVRIWLRVCRSDSSTILIAAARTNWRSAVKIFTLPDRDRHFLSTSMQFWSTSSTKISEKHKSDAGCREWSEASYTRTFQFTSGRQQSTFRKY